MFSLLYLISLFCLSFHIPLQGHVSFTAGLRGIVLVRETGIEPAS